MADNRITIQAEFGQSYKDLGCIGRVGENDSREIVFDCADALAQFPGASIVCVIKRACDTKPYSAALTDEGYNRILPLSAVETAVAGQIMIELRAVSNDTILKSAMFSGRISESLQGEGDRPGNPVRDVLDRVDSALQSATETQKKLLSALDGVDTAVDGANTADENAQAVADTVQAKLDNGDFVGPAGKDGANGKDGAPGSDASVTAENIQAALGYTPVKDVQVAGSSVLDGGVAKVPIAQEDAPGVVSILSVQDSGIWNDNGRLRISYATDAEISGRTGKRKTIVCANMDYAVKAAMCDGKGAAWTAAEQAAARNRMHAEGYGEFVLIESITLSETIERFERDVEPDGTPYNLSAMKIIIRTPPSDTPARGVWNWLVYSLSQNNYTILCGGITTIIGYKTSEALSFYRYSNVLAVIPQFGLYNCYGIYGSQGGEMSIGYASNSNYQLVKTDKKINKFSAFIYPEGSKIVAGTEIEIYGVRA